VNTLRLSVVIESDEDGYYVASVPELPGCHTQAKSLDELMERVKEAVDLYLEVEGPTTSKSKFVGVQFIEVKLSEPKANLS
jgi:predicted RNase H-like HicB family nuclease